MSKSNLDEMIKVGNSYKSMIKPAIELDQLSSKFFSSSVFNQIGSSFRHYESLQNQLQELTNFPRIPDYFGALDKNLLKNKMVFQHLQLNDSVLKNLSSQFNEQMGLLGSALSWPKLNITKSIAVNSINNPFHEIKNFLKNQETDYLNSVVSDALKTQTEATGRIINEFLDTLKDVDFQSGHLQHSGSTISVDKLEFVLQNHFHSGELSSNETYLGMSVKDWVTLVFIPLFVAWMSYYLPIAFKEPTERENKTELKQQVNSLSQADRSSYKDYSVVYVSKLNVHQTPKKRAIQIAVFQIGTLVKVEKVIKDWSLVTYDDTENEVMIKGWVLSRYLKKIR